MKTLSAHNKIAVLRENASAQPQVDRFVTPVDATTTLYRIAVVGEQDVTLESQASGGLVPVSQTTLAADYLDVALVLLTDVEAVGTLTSNELRGDVEVAQQIPHPSGHPEFRGR